MPEFESDRTETAWEIQLTFLSKVEELQLILDQVPSSVIYWNKLRVPLSVTSTDSLSASKQLLKRSMLRSPEVPKMLREKSRECHNHKPQPCPDINKKRKQTKPNKRKSNKCTKNTKISALFPKRGNRNSENLLTVIKELALTWVLWLDCMISCQPSHCGWLCFTL